MDIEVSDDSLSESSEDGNSPGDDEEYEPPERLKNDLTAQQQLWIDPDVKQPDFSTLLDLYQDNHDGQEDNPTDGSLPNIPDGDADLKDFGAFTEKPFITTCRKCQNSYHTPLEYVLHSPCWDIITNTDGMDGYHCPSCPKKFNRVLHLKMHMTYHLEKRFCCKNCGHKTHVADEIRKHCLKDHRITIRPYKCDVGDCQSNFITPGDVIKHKKKYHKDVWQESDGSTTTSSSSSIQPTPNYSTTIYTKSASYGSYGSPSSGKKKRYECPYCDNVYACNKAFKRHKEKIHGDNQNKTGSTRIRRWWKKPPDAEEHPEKYPRVSPRQKRRRDNNREKLPHGPRIHSNYYDTTTTNNNDKNGSGYEQKMPNLLKQLTSGVVTNGTSSSSTSSGSTRRFASKSSVHNRLTSPLATQSSSSSSTMAKSSTKSSSVVKDEPPKHYDNLFMGKPREKIKHKKIYVDKPDDFDCFQLITGPSEDGTLCPPALGILSCIVADDDDQNDNTNNRSAAHVTVS